MDTTKPDQSAMSPPPPRPVGEYDVQILSNEHAGLLSTRQQLWHEMFTRTSMYLTLVSGAVVALALMAQATQFGSDFRLFALVLLPIVLFVGIATFKRLLDATIFELEIEAALNRLRRGLLLVSPSLDQFFSVSSHDDEQGIMQSAGLRSSSSWSFIWTTPFITSVVNAMVAGVIVAIAMVSLDRSGMTQVAAGLIAGALVLILSTWHAQRCYDELRAGHISRFPSSSR
jgi:hypothetical protein